MSGKQLERVGLASARCIEGIRSILGELGQRGSVPQIIALADARGLWPDGIEERALLDAKKRWIRQAMRRLHQQGVFNLSVLKPDGTPEYVQFTCPTLTLAETRTSFEAYITKGRGNLREAARAARLADERWGKRGRAMFPEVDWGSRTLQLELELDAQDTESVDGDED